MTPRAPASLLARIVVAAARSTPTAVKRRVHRNRLLDRLTRRAFAAGVRSAAETILVQSGPLAGTVLVVTEHVSHAHISGTYELQTQLAIDRLVARGAICYDLGASIGYMSLLMARKAEHVFAFEPAPHTQEEIRKHVQANGLRNVTVVSGVVSDCKRTVKFALTDVAYGSRIVEGPTGWPTVTLTTLTLDDFARTHPFPDFIKIDVEGEEGRVIEGAVSVLHSGKAIICCELHSEEAARQVLGRLNAHGYRTTTLEGGPFELPAVVIPGGVHVIGLPPQR